MKKYLLVMLLILSGFDVSNWCLSHSAVSSWPMFRHDAARSGRSLYTGVEEGVFSWSYSFGDGIGSSPCIDSRGKVYVGADDGRLYSLSGFGAFRWSYSTGQGVESSPALIAGSAICVGSTDGRLYSLDLSGGLLWSYGTGDGITSSPSASPSGQVLIGSLDSNVYAFNTSGVLDWSYALGGKAQSSPAIGSGGALYIGGMDGAIYSLSSVGTFNWSYETGDAIEASPAVGEEVYIGSLDHRLYAMSSTGSLNWSYETGAGITSSAAVDPDGAVYVGSLDGACYGISSTGSLAWSFATGEGISSSPAVSSDGWVYVGSKDDSVYSFQPSTGALSGFATGGQVTSSPAIGWDGSLFFGSRDNRLYCLRRPAEITIGLSLNGTVFRTGDEIWITGTLTMLEHIEQGPFNFYLAVDAPDGNRYYLLANYDGIDIGLIKESGGLTERGENPQIALSLGKGLQHVVLSYDLLYGAERRRRKVDAYCAARTPSGRMYWYKYQNGFTDFDNVQPALSNFKILNDTSSVADWFYLWDRPEGIYSLYGVLVPHGKNVLKRKNWLCRLSEVSFERGPVTHISVFSLQPYPMFRNFTVSKDIEVKIGPVVVLIDYWKGDYEWVGILTGNADIPGAPNIISTAFAPFRIE